MAKFGTVTFTGASGTAYQFNAYPRDTDFKPIGAVYFMTRREPSGSGHSHTRIYVGETGDLSDRPLNHHRQDCFDRHRANCVCIHTESSRVQRLEIESDLLKKYDPPCNRQ